MRKVKEILADIKRIKDIEPNSLEGAQAKLDLLAKLSDELDAKYAQRALVPVALW